MSSPQPPGHEELLAPEGVVGSTVAAPPPSPAPDGLGRGAGSGSPRSAHKPPEEVGEASEETLGCDTGQGDDLRYQLMRGQDQVRVITVMRHRDTETLMLMLAWWH